MGLMTIGARKRDDGINEDFQLLRSIGMNVEKETGVKCGFSMGRILLYFCYCS